MYCNLLIMSQLLGERRLDFKPWKDRINQGFNNHT